jgi:nucleotide-binding universal stress UspA family protein
MTERTEAAARRPVVVVGVDGSDQSRTALKWGDAIARATGARLDAVMVWNYDTGYGSGYVPVDLNPGAEADKVLTSTVDAEFGPDRPETMRLAVRQGQPAKVLIDESKDALLLVVGSRGHGGFMGLLLGSVSSSVAEHATCPVLVLHGDEPPLQLIG